MGFIIDNLENLLKILRNVTHLTLIILLQRPPKSLNNMAWNTCSLKIPDA